MFVGNCVKLKVTLVLRVELKGGTELLRLILKLGFFLIYCVLRNQFQFNMLTKISFKFFIFKPKDNARCIYITVIFLCVYF